MSTRIPPSLKWLIDKRARLAAEIHKTKKALESAHHLIDELKALEETLAALDKTFELHKIQINVNLIRPINSKYLRLKLPHGSISSSIITCLKLYGESDPIPKSEIMNFLIARHYDVTEEEIPYIQISESVHNALKRMFREGYLERFHDPDTNKEGLWKLKQQ